MRVFKPPRKRVLRLVMTTKEDVMKILRSVLDPEIGINIVDLGLVYGVWVEEDRVHVKMTMSASASPPYDVVVNWTERSLASLPGVQSVKVELVWEPPWSPEMMTESAKRQLGFA